jgi:Zn-dependent protease
MLDDSTLNVVIELIIKVMVLFMCFPIHEAAHAWAANKMGDDTGRLLGRISLNPFVHLDPWGSICMILFGFGWAKPVPVNIYRFKNHRLGFALTALAGPMSNVLMALLVMILLKILAIFSIFGVEMLFMVISVLSYVISLNLVLAIFNMIPLPPLDGSKVLGLFMTDRAYDKFLRTTEPYSMYCMFGVLIIANAGLLPISNLVSWAVDGLDYITSFIA